MIPTAELLLIPAVMLVIVSMMLLADAIRTRYGVRRDNVWAALGALLIATICLIVANVAANDPGVFGA